MGPVFSSSDGPNASDAELLHRRYGHRNVTVFRGGAAKGSAEGGLWLCASDPVLRVWVYGGSSGIIRCEGPQFI
jgi:hypothetical protein